MTLYEIATLVTPPIIMKILHKCFKNEKSTRYIEKLEKKNTSTLNQITKNKEKMLIIGNGPSLNASLEKYINKFNDFDCIAVNHFCETKYYSQIKPKFYLLADPAYFGDTNTYADWQKKKVNNFIDSLVLNTKWDLNLIVPNIAIDSFFWHEIQKNSCIHPYIYNSKNLIANTEINKTEKFKLWDKNLIEPPAQTCLNTCVWLGIFLRYKEVYLIGADTNWIELMHVDQETNELYLYDTHFYGKKKKIMYIDPEGKLPSKIYKELQFIANSFYWYCELKEYADYVDVSVYNASEYSLIDAFERKKIN